LGICGTGLESLFLLDKKIFYQQAGRLFHEICYPISRATVIQIIYPHPPAPFSLLYICINLKVKWDKRIFSREI
jgi:hypothetical protein